jgi:pyruvate/2-oxoglutarate dehydrogenase complex dihydrolipoamide acyltransferase (E2) component
LITALLALLPSYSAGRERVSGVVRGAEALYVREGPGTEYTPFDSLPKGTEVEVQSVQGSWVEVRTADGRSGYVHAAFLRLSGDAAALEGGRAETAPAPSAATVPAAANAAEVQAQVEPTPTPAAAHPAAAALPAVADGGEELRTDVKRILRLTEELRDRMGEARGSEGVPPPALDASERALGVASTLALSGIGLLCGFIVGSFYGRRQERNRRTRVRF